MHAPILQSAVESREGIGVFEVPQRHPLAILLTFLMPIVAFVFAPFMRPFRWSRLLWTYLVPVVPFVVLFDGIVSCLRAYSSTELAELADGLFISGYKWEAGEVRGGVSPIPVTYLIAWPAKHNNRASGTFSDCVNAPRVELPRRGQGRFSVGTKGLVTRVFDGEERACGKLFVQLTQEVA